jgi:Flp pilus assembly protein TadG
LRKNRGSVTVEMVLLAPVLVLFVTFVVAAGRFNQAGTTVREAADSAAREASLVSVGRIIPSGVRRARAELRRGARWCSEGSADATLSQRNGTRIVTVRVSCAVNRTGILSVMAGPLRVVAESSEVIDAFAFR